MRSVRFSRQFNQLGGWGFLTIEGGQHGVDDMPGVEAGVVILAVLGIVVDEPVGQHHRPHLEAAVQQSGPGQEMQDQGREAADGAFLDGDQQIMVFA